MSLAIRLVWAVEPRDDADEKWNPLALFFRRDVGDGAYKTI